MSDSVLHWYCFVYTGKDKKSGLSATAAAYTGYRSKGIITVSMIEENKRNAGVTDDAVLLNVMYLGKATKYDFLRDSKYELDEKVT